MIPGVISGKIVMPRKVLLYGPHGIGKSTWPKSAPRPIYLQLEDGLNDIGVDRTELLTETVDVAKWLVELGGSADHGYKTVVIDTLDWLEKIIWAATCRDHGKNSIEDFGYAKGYAFAIKRWDQLLNMLACCRSLGMNIVLLAHAKIERFTPPDADPYDRWQPDMHKSVSPMIQEWVDEVLFASYRINTKKTGESFGMDRFRAIGTGERIVYTSETPTHAAKRRIEMPDTIPLEWSAYQQYWPTGSGPVGDINGIVKDGHSKKKEPQE